jgi:antimicrobial peptide system SdpA family protein
VDTHERRWILLLRNARSRLTVNIDQPQPASVPRAWILIATVVAVAVGIYVVQENVAPNVVDLPAQAGLQANVQTVLPEGWAFFTKPVSSENIYPYRQESSGRFSAEIAQPDGSPQYVFGWNRIARNQGVEITALLQGIAKKSWTDCTNLSRENCLSAAGRKKPIVVHNRLPERTVCGQVILSAERTTVWAYRNLTSEASTPIESLALEVTCG